MISSITLLNQYAPFSENWSNQSQKLELIIMVCTIQFSEFPRKGLKTKPSRKMEKFLFCREKHSCWFIKRNKEVVFWLMQINIHTYISNIWNIYVCLFASSTRQPPCFSLCIKKTLRFIKLCYFMENSSFWIGKINK